MLVVVTNVSMASAPVSGSYPQSQVKRIQANLTDTLHLTLRSQPQLRPIETSVTITVFLNMSLLLYINTDNSFSQDYTNLVYY